MRPQGKMVDWGSSGTRTEPDATNGIVPHTRKPDEFNYSVSVGLADWKRYRDGFELLRWGAPLPLGPEGGSSILVLPNDRRQHLAYDQDRYRVVLVGRDSSNPTNAQCFWQNADRAWHEGPSLSSVHPADRLDAQVAATGPGTGINTTAYVAWINNLNISGTNTEQSDTFFYFADATAGAMDGTWSESTDTPAQLYFVGGMSWADDESRMYVWGQNAGRQIGCAVLELGSGHTWEVLTFAETAPSFTPFPLLGACGGGHKVFSDSAFVYRTPNRFTPIARYTVSDILPGSTLLLGLFYAETDRLFVGVTDTGVWSSPNGVAWQKVSTPNGWTATGPGAASGGGVVLGATRDGAPWLLRGLNALRDWRAIPSPDTTPRALTSLDGRLALLGADAVRYSGRCL